MVGSDTYTGALASIAAPWRSWLWASRWQRACRLRCLGYDHPPPRAEPDALGFVLEDAGGVALDVLDRAVSLTISAYASRRPPRVVIYRAMFCLEPVNDMRSASSA
jgi:hypothetical protein